jgi:hypothetical protein
LYVYASRYPNLFDNRVFAYPRGLYFFCFVSPFTHFHCRLGPIVTVPSFRTCFFLNLYSLSCNFLSHLSCSTLRFIFSISDCARYCFLDFLHIPVDINRSFNVLMKQLHVSVFFDESIFTNHTEKPCPFSSIPRFTNMSAIRSMFFLHNGATLPYRERCKPRLVDRLLVIGTSTFWDLSVVFCCIEITFNPVLRSFLTLL